MIHGGHGGHGFFSSTEDTDFLVATLEILEEIFNKIWLMARNHYGSTEHTEDTEFFGSCFARNLGGNLLKEWPEARNNLPLCLHKQNL